MHTVGIQERWIIVLALLPPFVWCWVGWDGIIMELFEVAELRWGLDSVNYGFSIVDFWSVFWNLCLLATQLFHSTHCPGGLGGSLLFLSVLRRKQPLGIFGWGCSVWSFSTWGRCDLVQCTQEPVWGEIKLKRIWHLMLGVQMRSRLSATVIGEESFNRARRAGRKNQLSLEWTGTSWAHELLPLFMGLHWGGSQLPSHHLSCFWGGLRNLLWAPTLPQKGPPKVLVICVQVCDNLGTSQVSIEQPNQGPDLCSQFWELGHLAHVQAGAHSCLHVRVLFAGCTLPRVIYVIKEGKMSSWCGNAEHFCWGDCMPTSGGLWLVDQGLRARRSWWSWLKIQMILHCQVAQWDSAAKFVATELLKDTNICFAKAFNNLYGKKFRFLQSRHTLSFCSSGKLHSRNMGICSDCLINVSWSK